MTAPLIAPGIDLNTLRPVVDALARAWRDGQPAPAQAWVNQVPDAEHACAVQQLLGESLGWWAPGQMPAVWKSGAGSRTALLKHAGLPTPAVHLLASGEVADLSGRPWFSPVLESEIALRLGHDVSPSQAAELNETGAAALLDAMTVAIEVVDSRWLERGQASTWLQMADGQWHGALVFGPWQACRDLDWAAQACELQVEGQAPVQVRGTHPLGNPLWGLPHWLRHLTRHGATVPAGTVVTTGNWTGAVPMPLGATATACFAGIGAVSVRR